MEGVLGLFCLDEYKQMRASSFTVRILNVLEIGTTR